MRNETIMWINLYFYFGAKSNPVLYMPFGKKKVRRCLNSSRFLVLPITEVTGQITISFLTSKDGDHMFSYLKVWNFQNHCISHTYFSMLQPAELSSQMPDVTLSVY